MSLPNETPRVLWELGFSWGGTNEVGDTFWDGPGAGVSHLVIGSEGGRWGAGRYPTTDHALNGTGREAFPRTFSSADGVVKALRAAGWMDPED